MLLLRGVPDSNPFLNGPCLVLPIAVYLAILAGAAPSDRLR